MMLEERMKYEKTEAKTAAVAVALGLLFGPLGLLYFVKEAGWKKVVSVIIGWIILGAVLVVLFPEATRIVQVVSSAAAVMINLSLHKRYYPSPQPSPPQGE